ncbi:hypothetical protein B0H10DRAFT_1961020 [Mycena sp. CBHHK59/15]|nr:hypothetical protein B0H10DRAFT_1961020 [Mycena sp. CBHHK59/15]
MGSKGMHNYQLSSAVIIMGTGGNKSPFEWDRSIVHLNHRTATDDRSYDKTRRKLKGVSQGETIPLSLRRSRSSILCCCWAVVADVPFYLSVIILPECSTNSNPEDSGNLSIPSAIYRHLVAESSDVYGGASGHKSTLQSSPFLIFPTLFDYDGSSAPGMRCLERGPSANFVWG